MAERNLMMRGAPPGQTAMCSHVDLDSRIPAGIQSARLDALLRGLKFLAPRFARMYADQGGNVQHHQITGIRMSDGGRA